MKKMKQWMGLVIGLAALGLIVPTGCSKKEESGEAASASKTSGAKGETWHCMRPENKQCIQMQGAGSKADIMGMCKEAKTEPTQGPCSTENAFGSCTSKLGTVMQTSVTYNDAPNANMVEEACKGMEGSFTKH